MLLASFNRYGSLENVIISLLYSNQKKKLGLKKTLAEPTASNFQYILISIQPKKGSKEEDSWKNWPDNMNPKKEKDLAKLLLVSISVFMKLSLYKQANEMLISMTTVWISDKNQIKFQCKSRLKPTLSCKSFLS